MIDKIKDFFYKTFKKEKRITEEEAENSRAAAKDRLHIVLMQDRANISADFLDLMRDEIIEVVKKYIVVSEKEIDVRLTHSVQEDGTPNPPSLYANIPILNIRNDMKAKTEEEKRKIEKEEEIAKKEEEKAKDKDKKEEKKKAKTATEEETKKKEVKEAKKEEEKINIIIDKAKEIKKEAKKESKKPKTETKENKTKEKKN